MDEKYLNRLIEIMSEMLYEQKETNKRLDETNKRLDNVESRVGNVEEQLSKTNMAIGELRLSVMRLADQIEIVHDHEKRIGLLERKVFV